MSQLNIFSGKSDEAMLPKELVEYRPNLFNELESTEYLNAFIHNIAWEQRIITMYGKPVPTPRLTAWYGDSNADYAYSGNKFHPLPWTHELLRIKAYVEPIAGVVFNSVLLNYYRNGNDSVAWHSDDENELGEHPVIASVSFGQMRRFDIRHKEDHNRKFAIDLENGSLLLMKGDLQACWEHRIAKSTIPMKERINLTFRVIHRK